MITREEWLSLRKQTDVYHELIETLKSGIPAGMERRTWIESVRDMAGSLFIAPQNLEALDNLCRRCAADPALVPLAEAWPATKAQIEKLEAEIVALNAKIAAATDAESRKALNDERDPLVRRYREITLGDGPRQQAAYCVIQAAREARLL